MKRVLVVEDSLEIRESLKKQFQSQGFEVAEANDGIEGLEMNAKSQYDIIITDHNMPRMTGLDMVRQLRNNPKYKDLLVVMHTTESKAELKAQGSELGIRAWVVKPTAPEAISRMADKLLAKKAAS